MGRKKLITADKIRRTSIDLTQIAWNIKDKYATEYGLKELISAALVMFDNASEEQRTEAIKIAKKPWSKDEEIADAKLRLDKLLDNLDKSHVQILAEADCQQLAKLRQLIGPDSEPHQSDKPKAKESV